MQKALKMSNKNKISYQIEFFSDWHLGSGLSIAGDVDAAVLKDDETGLPYIPGKTLKGMLRHAADTILAFQSTSVITEDFVQDAFGLKTSPNEAEDEDKEKGGQCFFSNAYLCTDLQENIKEEKNASFLYRKIASTSICEETGIAKSQSLRKTEVTVPVVLYAYIGDVKEDWTEQFQLLFKMVKRMGLERHRGLGRCEFSLDNTPKK